MNSRHFTLAALTAAMLLVSPVDVAEQSNPQPSLRDVMPRPDAIFHRLDKLEQRLANLEAMTFTVNARPDKHGILRDESGRPIGIWGIDYPTWPPIIESRGGIDFPTWFPTIVPQIDDLMRPPIIVPLADEIKIDGASGFSEVVPDHLP